MLASTKVTRTQQYSCRKSTSALPSSRRMARSIASTQNGRCGMVIKPLWVPCKAESQDICTSPHHCSSDLCVVGGDPWVATHNAQVGTQKGWIYGYYPKGIA